MAAVAFDAPIDWDDPASWYLGKPDLAELADVHIKHPSGLALSVHQAILSQQSRVLKELFRSLRAPVGKRKAADEEGPLQLESPFNQHSLQEVAYLLRLLYNPPDCKPTCLSAAEEHLPGVIRLAHALHAPQLLAAISEGLTDRVQQLEGALRWLPLAEECQLDAAQDEGVRTLAASVLTATRAALDRPANASSIALRFQGLAQLGQSTLAAALTAVALTANAASPECQEELANCAPDVRQLAALRSPGLQQASLSWTIPGFLQMLEQPVPQQPQQLRLVSPRFGSNDRWQLGVLPQGEDPALDSISVSLGVCLPQGSRANLPCTFSVELLGEAGLPIKKGEGITHCFGGKPSARMLGVRLARVSDVRANGLRLMPDGAATFRTRVTWLELEAED